MKFLLVMDDVWSENVWYGLLRAPLSHGVSGSQVLVTTRSAGVALGMKAQHLHRVDKLQPEDSWILLKNQVSYNFHFLLQLFTKLHAELNITLVISRLDCMGITISNYGLSF